MICVCCLADGMLRCVGFSGELRLKPTRKPSLRPLYMYIAKARSGCLDSATRHSSLRRGVEMVWIAGSDGGLAELRHRRSAVYG